MVDVVQKEHTFLTEADVIVVVAGVNVAVTEGKVGIEHGKVSSTIEDLLKTIGTFEVEGVVEEINEVLEPVLNLFIYDVVCVDVYCKEADALVVHFRVQVKEAVFTLGEKD